MGRMKNKVEKKVKNMVQNCALTGYDQDGASDEIPVSR